MRINTIYNCIVLLYLQAFCLLLCFQIEDAFSVELNMLNIFMIGNSYWELFLRMFYLSPFIIYYFFKKKEDTESTSFDKVFGLILGIMLLAIVIGQLLSCGNNIISFNLPLIPGILCVGVNILSLALYYLWIYNQQKFPTNEKPNLVRICNILFVTVTLSYGLILANTYNPFKTMQALSNDFKLFHSINRISNLDKVYNNIDDIINTIDDKKLKRDIEKFTKDKHLSCKKIDENKYKVSWKTYLNKQEKESIKRSNINVSDDLYNNNEKTINIKDKNVKDNKNKKIKLNKQEAEAMLKLYETMDKQNRELLEQFDIEGKDVETKKKKI